MKSFRVEGTDGSVLVEEFQAADVESARNVLSTNHPEVKLGKSARLRYRKGNDWYDVGGRGTVTKA